MLNCEEVKINIHKYIDGQLDKATQNEMDSHLNSCDSCFDLYNNTATIIEKIKDLPSIVDLPFNIREILADEFLKKTEDEKPKDIPPKRINSKKLIKEQKRLERELKLSRDQKRKTFISKSQLTRIRTKKISFLEKYSFKKILIAIIPLIIIALGYFAFDLLKNNSPWEIEWKHGRYAVNGLENANLKLSKYETISTKDSSQMILYVPQTGRIEINSNSSVTLINPKNGSNKVRLNNGTIKMVTTAMIPYLTVEVKNFSVRDIGGVFTASMLPAGDAKLFVDFGMVEVTYQGISFKLDEGYICDIFKGKKPGTPYRFDASDSLKNAIRLFDSNEDFEIPLSIIIKEAIPSDVLTLLALIPKVPPVKRQLIFQKISNYFSPPKNVTRMGIVTLDLEMLELWWNDIEWRI